MHNSYIKHTISGVPIGQTEFIYVAIEFDFFQKYQITNKIHYLRNDSNIMNVYMSLSNINPIDLRR